MKVTRPGTEPATGPAPTAPVRPVAAWLAGRIGWDAYAAVAERLAWEVSEPGGRCPTLLVCELEPAITIGRLGSRADVALGDDEVRARGLAVRFTGRGGGAVPHVPGQVCVALFAALEDLGLAPHDAGGLEERFTAGLAAALAQVRCGPVRVPGVPGVFGRTGLLAAVGLAVRRGVACHGGFVNICPAPDLLPMVLAVPAACRGPDVPTTTMGSIEAELQRHVRPQDVRTALVHALAAAFRFPRTLVHSGLPVPAPVARRSSEVTSHVG
ncbi:MAG: lipoyl protein ligase domain-containing protein [Planctomycetaceae bacterium]